MTAGIDTTGTPGSRAAARPPRRRTREGVVTSDVRDKTITVSIERMIQHAKYGKYLRRRNKLHAHDERNEARRGDLVEIMECRPMSRTKSWRLVRVLRRHADGTAGHALSAEGRGTE